MRDQAREKERDMPKFNSYNYKMQRISKNTNFTSLHRAALNAAYFNLDKPKDLKITIISEKNNKGNSYTLTEEEINYESITERFKNHPILKP